MLRPARSPIRLNLLSAAGFVLCAQVELAYSAPPVAVITGPTQSNPGDLVILDASKSQDATAFAWALAGSDKTFLETDNGAKLVFASGTEGQYTFFLVAAGVDGNKPAINIAKHLLTIGNPGPGPGPNPPGPTPNPDPLPPGKYGLASFARDSAAGVSLDPAAKTKSATALASSFDSIASTIAAGAIKTPADAIGATQANNITALGTYRDAWRPWAETLRVKLNGLSDGGQMVSMEDYTTAWREIATGLRSVK